MEPVQKTGSNLEGWSIVVLCSRSNNPCTPNQAQRYFFFNGDVLDFFNIFFVLKARSFFTSLLKKKLQRDEK